MKAMMSIGYSDNYTNKLCKFLRGQQKLWGPVYSLKTGKK